MGVIGIDPGSNGGVAFVGESVRSDPLLWKPNIFGRRELQWSKSLILSELYTGELVPELIMVEGPQVRWGNRLKSIASNWWMAGSLHQFLLLLPGDIRIEYCIPQQWHNVVLWPEWEKLGNERTEVYSERKEASISIIKNIYPDLDLSPGRKRSPQDGMADAVCIALYGELVESGSVKFDRLWNVRKKKKK